MRFLAHSQRTDNRMAALAMNVVLASCSASTCAPDPLSYPGALFAAEYRRAIAFSHPHGTPPSMSNAFVDFLPSLMAHGE